MNAANGALAVYLNGQFSDWMINLDQMLFGQETHFFLHSLRPVLGVVVFVDTRESFIVVFNLQK